MLRLCALLREVAEAVHIAEAVAEAVAEYDYPVCYNAPFGHIGTENRALLLGGEMEMKSRGDGSFELKTRI